MKKKEMIKIVGGSITGLGIGFIIGDLVKKLEEGNTNKLKGCCIMAGGIVLAKMIGDKVGEYFNKTVDDFSDNVSVELEISDK